MEDLSSKIPAGPVTGLAPTSQSSVGNESSSNENAMTAPGTAPAIGLPPEAAHEAPQIEAVARPEPGTVTHGQDDGLRGGPPVLRMGRWNDLGGGGAPEGYEHA